MILERKHSAGDVEESPLHQVPLRNHGSGSSATAVTAYSPSLHPVDTRTQLTNILKRHNLKRVVLINIFVILRQLTGAYVVLMYTVDIFASAGSSLSPNTSAIVVGLVQLLVVLFSNVVTDVVGRKTLIVSSGVAMSISHAVMAVYCFLKSVPSHDELTSTLSWIPLVCLVTFVGFFSLGFAPALYIFMIELIPREIKDCVSGLVVISNSLGSFAVVNSYYSMKDGIGEGGMFLLFACACFSAAVYCHVVLPETKGKTLEEIEMEITNIETEV